MVVIVGFDMAGFGDAVNNGLGTRVKDVAPLTVMMWMTLASSEAAEMDPEPPRVGEPVAVTMTLDVGDVVSTAKDGPPPATLDAAMMRFTGKVGSLTLGVQCGSFREAS